MQNVFQEPEYTGNIQRMTYLSDIEKLIAERRAASTAERDRFMADYPAGLEKLRARYLDMLGWPLNSHEFDDYTPTAEETYLGSDERADIYRVIIETMPGLRFGGILFIARDHKRRPLVISQHGGLGTPELCSSLYRGGDSSNYNDMTQRVLARGVHVFAPQLLLWNKETYHIQYDRQMIDNSLKQLGGSITALEIYCIMRSIDYLIKKDYVDETRVGMVGLSYGGFYTLFTAAADPRIKSCIASGFFNDRFAHNWLDWTWKDAGHTFMDAEIGALIAPRGLKMQLGTHDALFAEAPARKELERHKTFFERAHCPEKLYMEFFDGTHEFSKSEETIDLFMNDLA